ncbi:MAG TPA: reverse transcriptase N-terminal domain-containing protein [Candidatus Blautia ornithocaccae]|nr:reverse transcriptase N-terminal domain-containing protein [Candidatus Blautia ornithocaccae]
MESMNAQSSMAHDARTMQTKRIKWKNINWIIAESYVNRLQVRIVKAVQKDKWRLAKRLQKLITNSFYAKAIAVKRVITNLRRNNRNKKLKEKDICEKSAGCTGADILFCS